MSEALLVKAEKVLEKQSKAVLPMLREKFMQAKPSDLTDLAINGGLAYLGWKAFKTPEGALWGPVALKMVQGESEAAGIAGVVGLAALSVAQAVPKEVEAVVEFIAKGVEGVGVFPPFTPTGEPFAILGTTPADFSAFIAGEKVFIDGEWRNKEDVIAPTVDSSGLIPFFTCPEGWHLVRGPSAAVCVKDVASGSGAEIPLKGGPR